MNNADDDDDDFWGPHKSTARIDNVREKGTEPGKREKGGGGRWWADG